MVMYLAVPGVLLTVGAGVVCVTPLPDLEIFILLLDCLSSLDNEVLCQVLSYLAMPCFLILPFLKENRGREDLE